ncbi:thioesterase II family protein [Lentzea chajnantorensis]
MSSAITSNAWLRRFRPRDSAPVRLVCLPHAGGSATYFLPVAAALDPSVDVLAVQYPGRQDRRTEPFVRTIDELAELVTEQLSGWTDRPLALFGHSMGATLGFEVARRLERAGTVPVALFVSGRRAPSCFRDERVHQEDDEQLLADVRALSGTDARLFGDEEIMRMVLPALRADYEAAETYRYEPGEPLRAPVVSMVGDADSKVTVDEARAWDRHTSGEFDFHVYPGGHFFLDEHATAVIDMIKRRLLG